MANNKTIKFYSNYKDGKVFVSGQNEKKVWLSLWKSTEFNKDLYLNNDKFKGGCEIEKSKLRLLDNEPGCRVLVFKDAEDEKEFCITKEEIEERKKQRKAKAKQETKLDDGVFELLGDILSELVGMNKIEYMPDGIVAKVLDFHNQKVKEKLAEQELEEIEEPDELPF